MQQTYEGFLRLESNSEEDDILWLDTKSNNKELSCIDIWEDEPLAEILEEEISGKQVCLKYYISNKKLSLEDAEACFIRIIEGEVDAEYTMRYSEYTGYLWTDEEIKIGGHNLLEELKSNKDKYLILIVDICDRYFKRR